MRTPSTQPNIEAATIDIVARINLASEITSNDGAYRVQYATQPHPIPVNEPFEIDVLIIRSGEVRGTATGAMSLSADAGMPEHAHGMNVEPTIENMGDGRFRVSNMMFHMSGRWEIYFDVSRDGVTSRAQDEITLE